MNSSQNNLLETWNSRITEEGWTAFRAIPSRIIISRGKKPDEINLTRIRTSSSSSSRCRLITLEYNFNTIAAFLRAKQGKLFRYSARNICPPVDSIRSFFPVFLFFFSSSLDRWKIVWSFFFHKDYFIEEVRRFYLFIYYFFFKELLMIIDDWFILIFVSTFSVELIFRSEKRGPTWSREYLLFARERIMQIARAMRTT